MTPPKAESLYCTITGDREAVDLAFATYANGSVVNVYRSLL
jgi:hypothetical protein